MIKTLSQYVWAYYYFLRIALVTLQLVLASVATLALARLFKARVNCFTFGIGPRLFGYRSGGTEYEINSIPIYCNASVECKNLPVCKLLIIELSEFLGLFTFAVGVVLVCWGLDSWQRNSSIIEPVVSKVDPGSAAEMAGILPGDRILAVSGSDVKEWSQVVWSLKCSIAGDAKLKLLRGSEPIELVVSVPASDNLLLQTTGTAGLHTANERQIVFGPLYYFDVSWRTLWRLLFGRGSQRNLRDDRLMAMFKNGELAWTKVAPTVVILVFLFNLVPLHPCAMGRFAFACWQVWLGRKRSISDSDYMRAEARWKTLGWITVIVLCVIMATSV